MKHTLRGSTLTETLVVMLVTGIVFLAAMEALTLVSRLVTRRAAVLAEAGRQRDGIFRLGQLLTTADSIRSAEGGADAGGHAAHRSQQQAGQAAHDIGQSKGGTAADGDGHGDSQIVADKHQCRHHAQHGQLIDILLIPIHKKHS